MSRYPSGENTTPKSHQSPTVTLVQTPQVGPALCAPRAKQRSRAGAAGLTSEAGRLVLREGVALGREEPAARAGGAKQAVGRAGGRAKPKAGAGGGGGWLVERGRTKQSSWRQRHYSLFAINRWGFLVGWLVFSCFFFLTPSPLFFNNILPSGSRPAPQAQRVPGFVCVLPKRPPVLLFDPKAEVPNAPPLVVPKPASENQHQRSDKAAF